MWASAPESLTKLTMIRRVNLRLKWEGLRHKKQLIKMFPVFSVNKWENLGKTNN